MNASSSQVKSAPAPRKLSPLETLKKHLLTKIVTYLQDEEVDNLLLTHKSQIPTNTTDLLQQQQQQQQQQQPKDSKQDTVTKQKGQGGKVEWTESALPKIQQEQKQQEQEQGQDSSNKSSTKLPTKIRNLPSQFYTIDPDTLLSRLNTRRLFQRLKEPIPVDDPDGVPYIYPTHMTTEEIALFEWQNILKRANREASEATTTTTPLPPQIPCSKEVLLFSPCPRHVAVLASYPRSGNSLLRTMYERITLRVTGSDMRGGLVEHDLVGEAATGQNKVQFVKTHFPERQGTPSFPTSRVVLLVRNPYDALESYFNLMMTGTHTTSLTDEMRAKTLQIWEDMVRKEVQVWKEFHEYWLKQDVPMLLVRYEDLIRFPYETMCRVIKFTCDVNNMYFFGRRIRYCMDQENNIAKLGSYQPRSGGIGKSLQKYSPELLQEMNVGLLSTMEKFEYTSLLVPNKEDWELEPLEGYAREYFPSKGQNNSNPVMVNQGPLVRTPKHRTDWARLKREMAGGQEQKCQCPKCLGLGR